MDSGYNNTVADFLINDPETKKTIFKIVMLETMLFTITIFIMSLTSSASKEILQKNCAITLPISALQLPFGNCAICNSIQSEFRIYTSQISKAPEI